MMVWMPRTFRCLVRLIVHFFTRRTQERSRCSTRSVYCCGLLLCREILLLQVKFSKRTVYIAHVRESPRITCTLLWRFAFLAFLAMDAHKSCKPSAAVLRTLYLWSSSSAVELLKAVIRPHQTTKKVRHVQTVLLLSKNELLVFATVLVRGNSAGVPCSQHTWAVEHVARRHL